MKSPDHDQERVLPIPKHLLVLGPTNDNLFKDIRKAAKLDHKQITESSKRKDAVKIVEENKDTLRMIVLFGSWRAQSIRLLISDLTAKEFKIGTEGIVIIGIASSEATRSNMLDAGCTAACYERDIDQTITRYRPVLGQE